VVEAEAEEVVDGIVATVGTMSLMQRHPSTQLNHPSPHIT